MTRCRDCKETGGRFRLVGKRWVHVNCSAPKVYHKTPTFPFVTNNIGDPNDGPITVNSMRHLRQLEVKHGVQSEVYNNDSSYQGGRY